nr:oxidoreductase [bacterium]
MTVELMEQVENRYVATTLEGFIQQLAVSYVKNGHPSRISTGRPLLVPTLRAVPAALRLRSDAERRRRHSPAERGNEGTS